jgi:nucleoside-diphosphate-sugar epimerase
LPKRIVVTGGAGYVGSIVVNELLERGYAVRVLDSLLHGHVPSLLPAWGHSGFEFVRADVRDREARASVLEGADGVVHLAAIVGDPACARDPDLAREVNLQGTLGLLEDCAANGVARFLFASTCSNYGRMDSDSLASEDVPLAPISLYAETKVAAEEAVLARGGDLVACCLRFATVYGSSPRMRFDLTVNEFTRELALERELLVYGEQFWRPYVHVRDAASAVVTALEAPAESVAGEVFNVGETEENYRKLDLVELLRERFPAAQVTFVPRDEDPRDYRVSFEKVNRELGFKAERTVPVGIDELIALLRSGFVEDPYSPVYAN